MADIIFNHNHPFTGKNGRLLRTRTSNITTDMYDTGQITSLVWDSVISNYVRQYAQIVTYYGTINKVSGWWGTMRNPNLNIRCKIYTGNLFGQDPDTISNTLLATSTNVISTATIGTFSPPSIFNFEPITLDGQYTVAFFYENVVVNDNTNAVRIRSSQTNQYSGGNMLYSTNNYLNYDLAISLIYEL